MQLLWALVCVGTLAFPFTTVWRTSAPSEIVTLPIYSQSDGNISWGDGNPVPFSTSVPLNHSYSVADDYTISIEGSVFGWNFNDTTLDHSQLIEIVSWGGFTIDSNSASMFQGCTNLRTMSATDQPVFLSNASLLNMFRDCVKFKIASPVTWDTRNVSVLSYMFYNASRFDQGVNFDTGNVIAMDSMFASTFFEQDLSAWTVESVSSCSGFCFSCGLPNFTDCSPCPTPTLLNNIDGLKVCNCPFGQLNQTATQCVGIECTGDGIVGYPGRCHCDMGFSGSVDYDGNSTIGCTAIECDPPAYTGDPAECECGDGYVGQVFYDDDSTFGCRFEYPDEDLCPLAKGGFNLRIECLAPAPSPSFTPTNNGTTGGVIVSPIYNITSLFNSSSTDVFAFTLPINQAAVRAVVVKNCYGSVVRCEWQDPVTKQFQASGCTTGGAMPLENSTHSGVQCICTHLTVFALVLREDLKQDALCQADTQDYVLIALYALVEVVLLGQVTRLVIARAFAVSFVQHSCLVLAALLRIVFLVAKPVISSAAGLVILGLLPSALVLSVFTHVLLAWASLQLFAMEHSPFAKFRIPLLVIIVCVFLVSIAITIAVAAEDDSISKQQTTVVDGSYLLAAMYATQCILILWSGLGLNHMLQKSMMMADGPKIRRVRLRVLVSSVGLSVCLLLEACLWIAAVQDNILGSVAATLATSVTFYVLDWLSLVVLVGLFAPGVNTASVGKKLPLK